MPQPNRRGRRGAVRGLIPVLLAGLVGAVLPLAPASAAEPVRVMPLGDSITDGYDVPGAYRTHLEDLLADGGLAVDFVGSRSNGPSSLADREHEGHSGWRIEQLHGGIASWMAQHRPDVVLLKAGTNDMLWQYQVGTAPQRLGALIDGIVTARPSTRVIVSTLAPTSGGAAHERIRAFNAALPAVVDGQVRRGRDVRLVDVHAALTTADLTDGIHPTAAGHAKVAATWYPALRDVLGGPEQSKPKPGAPVSPDVRREVSALPWLSATNGYGPAERNRSNGEWASGDGRVLTLQGQAFRSGLGVHAGSDIRFLVPRGCTRFDAVVGVDDEVGSRGSVVFQVFDGARPVYDSGRRTGSSANATVSAPLTPGAAARLVVTDAGDGIGHDHADWAGATLSCASSG